MADSLFANVRLLVHGNGSLTDVKGHSISSGGSIASSATQAKFGSGSIYFNGSNQWYGAGGADFATTAGQAFAIECQIYPTSAAASGYNRCIFCLHDGSTVNLSVVQRSDNSIGIIHNGFLRLASSAISINSWHQILLVYENGNFKLYVDTVLAGTYSVAGYGIGAGWAVIVGTLFTSFSWFEGYIDEVRVTTGVARPNEAQTAEFPDSYGEIITTTGTVSASAILAGNTHVVLPVAGGISAAGLVSGGGSSFATTKGVISAVAAAVGKSGATMPAYGRVYAASNGRAVSNSIILSVAEVSSESFADGRAAAVNPAIATVISSASVIGGAGGLVSSQGSVGAISELNGSSASVLPARGVSLASATLSGEADQRFGALPASCDGDFILNVSVRSNVLWVTG
jgi:hypothetical protein